MNKSTTSIDNDQSDIDDTDHEISKSQRKRDADEIRVLGERLTALGASELATIPLPDDVQAAIAEYSRIKANGARKRQLGFLAKRLRNADIDPIENALEKIRQKARASTVNLHVAEQWRDRLLGKVEDESSRDALTAYLNQFPQADRQQLRHLQAQAIKEQQKNKPPSAARQLFKSVRQAMSEETDWQE